MTPHHLPGPDTFNLRGHVHQLTISNETKKGHNLVCWHQKITHISLHLICGRRVCVCVCVCVCVIHSVPNFLNGWSVPYWVRAELVCFCTVYSVQ